MAPNRRAGRFQRRSSDACRRLPECNHTGYRGRTGVYELFSLNDAARRLIHDGASEAELRAEATRNGWLSLYDDGLRWVAAGETTLEEVMRVARA
jgi:general secretion pathway protein E